MTVRIAFVGDIYLGPEAEPWLGAAVPDLHQELDVDIVVGNFESVVDGHSVLEPHPGKVHLSVPSISLPKLRDMGIDKICVANNHIADYGAEGSAQTIDALLDIFGRDSVFGWSGQPSIQLRPGVRVVGACFPETNPVIVDGELRISTQGDVTEFLKTKSSPREQCIVVAHWGEEHLFLTSPALRATAARLISAGATHVVGTHSHVVGGSEGTRESSIVYSLGNFLFRRVRFGNTRLLKRNRQGAVAVYGWDGSTIVLEEFWRSEFDNELNLRVRRLARDFPGSVLSQAHLRAPAPLDRWAYDFTEATRWFDLGLANLAEGVERPTTGKVRTLLRKLWRRPTSKGDVSE